MGKHQSMNVQGDQCSPSCRAKGAMMQKVRGETGRTKKDHFWLHEERASPVCTCFFQHKEWEEKIAVGVGRDKESLQDSEEQESYAGVAERR